MNAAPDPAVVDARLLTAVSSYRSKPGDRVELLIAPPACSQPGPALPPGSVVVGSVRHVHKVGLGLLHETARIEFDLRELRLPDGRAYPVEARLASIDNARERVDSRGAVHGIRSTATLSGRFGSRIAMAALGHPFALGPMLLAESFLLRFPDPEIEYGRGTEFQLQLVVPESLNEESGCEALEGSFSPYELATLHRIIDELPYWSYSKRQPQPMDLVNLLFIGGQQEIRAAFRAAGWDGSAPNSVRAGFHAIRAIAEDRNYPDAPMRTLLLDGDEPGLRFQEGLNTFAKRDHLRIWLRSEDWHGRDVWASAATRDTGAIFSMEHPFGFTHSVEMDVDVERDRVVRDLLLTGCVDSVAYVNRPESVYSAGREYRRGATSDSRVAVVIFNACERPRRDEDDASPPLGPSLPLRLVRRITLTARDHFLRDNIYWRTGEGVRFGWHAVRGWRRRREEERRAEALREEAAAR